MITDSPKKILFTVDVEDWFQVENFKSSIPFHSWEKQQLRVERNTHRILELLEDSNLKESPKATFFVLGWIARKLPGLIKEIHSRGHEIASHGINHHLCTDEAAGALRRDLTDSKKLLEDIVGDAVCGYRAPSFSINNDVLKTIEDAGYRYDASYNSFDKHGRYGKLSVNGFQRQGIAYRVSNNFWELPVSNLILQPSIINLQPILLPWGGGGYFRLIPYVAFRKGIRRILAKENAYSFYLHPWELDPDQPRVENAPSLLKFRHYVNLGSTAKKIVKMLDDFSGCQFVTCGEYVETVARCQNSEARIQKPE